MKTLFTALLISTVLSLSGCLSYSQNQLQQVEKWPLGAEQKAAPSAYIHIETQYLHNDKPTNGQFNLAKLEKLILDEYQGSQRFSRVTTSKENSDLYLDIHLSNNERSSLPLAFLSGFTMMVIPLKASNELTMETVFKNAEGEELGKVTKRETTTTWAQLLLIFAMPFSQSVDPILTQMTRSTLEEAAKKGLI